MTPELRSQISLARLQAYATVILTSVGILLGVAAIHEVSGGGYSAPLTMLAIFATVYGVLAGSIALTDVDSLIKDMTPEFAQTHYGKGIAARNMGAFKIVSATLLGLTGVAELWAIWF